MLPQGGCAAAEVSLKKKQMVVNKAASPAGGGTPQPSPRQTHLPLFPSRASFELLRPDTPARKLTPRGSCSSPCLAPSPAPGFPSGRWAGQCLLPPPRPENPKGTRETCPWTSFLLLIPSQRCGQAGTPQSKKPPEEHRHRGWDGMGERCDNSVSKRGRREQPRTARC